MPTFPDTDSGVVLFLKLLTLELRKRNCILQIQKRNSENKMSGEGSVFRRVVFNLAAFLGFYNRNGYIGRGLNLEAPLKYANAVQHDIPYKSDICNYCKPIYYALIAFFIFKLLQLIHIIDKRNGEAIVPGIGLQVKSVQAWIILIKVAYVYILLL